MFCSLYGEWKLVKFCLFVVSVSLMLHYFSSHLRGKPVYVCWYIHLYTHLHAYFFQLSIFDSQYSCGSDYQVPLKTISENSFSSPFFPLPIKDFPHKALTSSQELFWKGGLTAQRLFHWASWHMEKRWLKLQQKPSFPQHHITLLFDPSTWAP